MSPTQTQWTGTASEWRTRYHTIFRNGMVILAYHDGTAAWWRSIEGGRWMQDTEPTLSSSWKQCCDPFHSTMSDALRADIKATVAACYCDKGVRLCDFCGGIRKAGAR